MLNDNNNSIKKFQPSLETIGLHSVKKSPIIPSFQFSNGGFGGGRKPSAFDETN